MSTQKKVPWLVMVYLAGDNNLTDEMVLAMQDLLAEGAPDGDKIVAQFDPSGNGLATQRYDFTKKGPGRPLEEYRDQAFHGAEANTGDPAMLKDFIEWAIAGTDEDTRYLLILSGHGSGTTEEYLMRDQTSADALTIPELARALRLAKPAISKQTKQRTDTVDILGLDACYMAMGEVAYEIRDCARIMIGSEGAEPAFGWPYRRILAKAKKRRPGDPPMTVADLATTIVREYVDFYADHDRAAGRSADLAAIDLTQIRDVKRAFSGLVQELARFDKADHERLLLAHWYAQTYKFHQYVDLKDLCRQIREFLPGHPVGTHCSAVIRAIDSCVVKSGCTGFACQFSWGLSIYFPWGFVSPDYRNLAFPTRTGWYRFLNEHVRATQRQPRTDYLVPEPALLPTLWSPGARNIDSIIAERRWRLDRLKQCAVEDRTERLGRDETTIVCRMRAALHSRQPFGDARTRLDEALQDIAQADIPAEDLNDEIARRLGRSGVSGAAKVRYTAATRYTHATRYTEDSRSPESRERSFKNLPPVVGKAYCPPEQQTTPAPAPAGERVAVTR